MNRESTVMIAAAAAAIACAHTATAAVVLLSQFAPGLGEIAGCGFDHTTNRVWVYDSSAAVISSYSAAGAFLGSVARPGESANDVDVEVAPEDFVLGTTRITAGTLLFINGESGTADIYAVNKTTGAVIATLATSFGASHVVGGSYHPCRGTFFLVQDKIPGGVNANRVAEINPETGAVINSFQTSPAFIVNFGDIEVSAANGNLLLVSSDETSIGEFTPTGQFVQDLPLPAGVSSLSGIGLDDATGEAWVSGTGGSVWRLGGLPVPCKDPAGDVNRDCVVNVSDLLAVISAWGPVRGHARVRRHVRRMSRRFEMATAR